MLADTIKQTQSESILAVFARYWLYPLLWVWTIFWLYQAYTNPDQLKQILAVKGMGMIGTLLLFEWIAPYRANWGMTWRFFLQRDLVLAVVNIAFMGVFSYGFVFLAVWVSGLTEGPMSGAPVWTQVVVGLLAFETMQYSIHRMLHKSGSPITNFLWRTHAIHHLPQQLYVIMHAVFHPFNAVIVKLFVQLLPLWVFGFDPYAVLVTSSIIGFHATISHLNVDMRIGWANYLFIGPELHRYHHSAKTHEAVNYGAAISLYDLLFGTFLYTPGKPPEQLGLAVEDGYPAQIDPLASILFPLSLRPVEPMEKVQDPVPLAG